MFAVLYNNDIIILMEKNNCNKASWGLEILLSYSFLYSVSGAWHVIDAA